MGSYIFKFLLLLTMWVTFSGHFTLFYLTCGILTAGTVVFFHRKNMKSTPLTVASGNIVRGVLYAFWLLYQVILAAVHVSKLILSPKLIIAPKMITKKTSCRSDIEKTIFANSITLTPGTITADISEDTLTIHQIDNDSAAGIVSGKMEEQIKKIFKGK